MRYYIYEFDSKKERVIAKHIITGVNNFESAKRAAEFMAGRKIGFCIIEER